MPTQEVEVDGVWPRWLDRLIVPRRDRFPACIPAVPRGNRRPIQVGC